jgi:hypothetical protein
MFSQFFGFGKDSTTSPRAGALRREKEPDEFVTTAEIESSEETCFDDNCFISDSLSI